MNDVKTPDDLWLCGVAHPKMRVWVWIHYARICMKYFTHCAKTRLVIKPCKPFSVQVVIQ